MDRIANAFAQAAAENRACFVAYLCAGDPDFDASLAACRAVIEAGADILELGVPYSDPLADGTTNQRAAQRALASGMDYAGVFRLVRKIREFSEVPIVFYTYYNLVFSRGSLEYARESAAAGVDGILTLDLPPEEGAEHFAACREVGMKTVCIVAPTTQPERLAKICDAATGFVYYVSREGVTGVQDKLATNIAEKVATIRVQAQCPVVVGFGISSAEHVRSIAAVAEGVVVGSALVNCIAENPDDANAIAEALRGRMNALTADRSLWRDPAASARA